MEFALRGRRNDAAWRIFPGGLRGGREHVGGWSDRVGRPNDRYGGLSIPDTL